MPIDTSEDGLCVLVAKEAPVELKDIHVVGSQSIQAALECLRVRLSRAAGAEGIFGGQDHPVVLLVSDLAGLGIENLDSEAVAFLGRQDLRRRALQEADATLHLLVEGPEFLSGDLQVDVVDGDLQVRPFEEQLARQSNRGLATELGAIVSPTLPVA